MKNQPQPIPEFDLPPLAKAGVLVRRLQHRDDRSDHATSRPHRDRHYMLLLATKGHYTINLDFEPVTFAAPALLIVFPGQVHHLIDMAQPQGWGISFDASLLDGESQQLLEQVFTGPRPVDAHSDFYPQFITLGELLENLQSGRADAHVHRAIRALLNALLSLITSQFAPEIAGTMPKESRAVLIEQAFRRLLNQRFVAWKQPARYADELAISVAHLNDTVKAITGRSVSVHIQQRSVLEAKRLLCHTDLSIKEVGYQVGYDEPVYFGKRFRKVTGTTPRHFRQQFRE